MATETRPAAASDCGVGGSVSERGVVLTASVGAAGWGVESEVEHAHSEQIKSQASTDRIAPSFGAQGLKYKRFGFHRFATIGAIPIR